MKKISLIVEFLLFILLIIAFVFQLISNIKIYTEITVGLLLLTMSYNNQKYFKRKYMTFIYLLFGIIAIISSAVELING